MFTERDKEIPSDSLDIDKVEIPDEKVEIDKVDSNQVSPQPSKEKVFEMGRINLQEVKVEVKSTKNEESTDSLKQI